MERLRRHSIIFIITLIVGLVLPAAHIAIAASNSIRPASATMTAKFDNPHKKIKTQVSYMAWQKVGRDNDKQKVLEIRKITGIEVLVNGKVHESRSISASSRGKLDVSINLSSLPAAERSKPLKIQAKTYSRYSTKHPGKNKLSATSNTVQLQTAPATTSVTQVAWQPAAISTSLLAGTSKDATIGFTSSKAIPAASLEISSSLKGIIAQPPKDNLKVDSGKSYSLPLAISTTASTEPGSHSGTVNLLSNGNVVSQLPVTVIVSAANTSVIPPTTAIADASRETDYQGFTVVRDEILVGLTPDLPNPDQRIKDIASQTGGQIMGSVPGTATYQLRYNVASLGALETLRNTTAGLPDVSFASHHFMGSTTAIPNDNQYPAGSWGENVSNQRNWGLKYIKAPQAWDTTTGSSSTGIAIIDGQFNPGHEDLKSNIISSTGFMPEPNILVDPLWNWHGTHVAGTACAAGNNGIGISGVMWSCSMRLYAPALHSEFSAMHTMELMKQAADDGARVVNMSIGWSDTHSCNKPGTGTDSTLQAVKEVNQVLERGVMWGERNDKDVLWVFAAGNECRDVKYVAPASLTLTHPSNTMAVAAIKQAAPGTDSTLLPESNYGAGITVAAPGEDIYSTTMTQCIDWLSLCRLGYATMSGTSMAAPHVTGLAGLVASKHPDYTASAIKQCIVDAANQNGRNVGGQSFKTISAPEAVNCQKPAPPTTTPGCIFSRGTSRPNGCESTNPTVEVDFYKTGPCMAKVDITWEEDNPATMQTFDVSDLAPGEERMLGRHTYSKPGGYWIKQEPRASNGDLCVFVGLSYRFVLNQP